jgi:hypothetical protein
MSTTEPEVPEEEPVDFPGEAGDRGENWQPDPPGTGPETEPEVAKEEVEE